MAVFIPTALSSSLKMKGSKSGSSMRWAGAGVAEKSNNLITAKNLARCIEKM